VKNKKVMIDCVLSGFEDNHHTVRTLKISLILRTVQTLSANSRFCQFKKLAVRHKISVNWRKSVVIGSVSHDFLPIGRKVMKP